MKENYSYPMNIEWQTDEIIIVMKLWQHLELAYERGVETSQFMESYQDFKKVIPGIGEERRLGREFEEITGYSLYHTVKEAKSSNKKILKMK